LTRRSYHVVENTSYPTSGASMPFN